MQYEGIVYKAGILTMAVRLEEFLVKEWEKRTGNNFREKRLELSRDNEPYWKFLIEEFLKRRKVADEKAKNTLKSGVQALFPLRNKIAHPSDHPVNESDFREDSFKRVREKCLEMDAALKGLKPLPDSPLPRMGEVMVSCSLRYDMGNAGDIIKHGVLAEFAEWWDGRLRFADPFGGRPWGVAKKEVREQLRLIPGCALLRALEQNNRPARVGVGLEKYYGSSHVVLNAAGELAEVFASDSDKLAREDLRAARIMHKSSGLSSKLEPLEKKIRGYAPGNGYSILDHADQFDLILIDPYADFLRDELALREMTRLRYGRQEDRYFSKIQKAILSNKNLWIAVFVLMKGDEIGAYEKLREEHFAGRFIALRFPKRKIPAGENRYNMEILLVSSRLATKELRIDSLRKNIAKFKEAAGNALGSNNIHLDE